MHANANACNKMHANASATQMHANAKTEWK
jgi:hypothetical protein